MKYFHLLLNQNFHIGPEPKLQQKKIYDDSHQGGNEKKSNWGLNFMKDMLSFPSLKFTIEIFWMKRHQQANKWPFGRLIIELFVDQGQDTFMNI